MNLKIWNLEKEIFSGDVKNLTVRAIDGFVQILPGHTNYINKLASGTVSFTDLQDKKSEIQVSGGLLKVEKDLAQLFV